MISKKNQTQEPMHKEICIVRFICNIKNICELIGRIESLTSSSDETALGSRGINRLLFYTYTGKEWNATSLYRQNVFSTHHFEANHSDCNLSSARNFFKCSLADRWLFFEAMYSANYGYESSYEKICDPICFQYVHILQRKLENANINYRFLVFAPRQSKESDTPIYTPISDKDFFQIRTYLFFESAEDNNNLFFLTGRDSENRNWKRSFDSNKVRKISKDKDDPFGKILPLITISQDFYKKSQKKIDENRNDIYSNLVANYYKRAQDSWPMLKDSLNKSIQADSLFELLIFFSFLSYLSSKKVDLTNEADFAILHEKCMDFAQGVFQLVENSLFHAILDSDGEEQGVGTLSIRIREKNDILPFIKKDCKESADYYLEVCIADHGFELSDQFCIVNKFYKNIEMRVEHASTQYKECLKKLLNDKKIELKCLFGTELSSVQADSFTLYLQNPETVAYHYGLQILDNTIKTAGGYLFVRSGNEAGNQFDETNEDKYCQQGFPWHNGTAYLLFFPIKLEEHIDRTDSIAIRTLISKSAKSNLSPVFHPGIISTITECIMSEQSCGINERTKSRVAEAVYQKCNRSFYGETVIHVIDCQDIFSHSEYEVLSKFIFKLLSEQNSPKIIALINLQNRHDVIKLFRYLSLFYNRNGENIFMKGKTVFIIDKDAKIDLILQDTIQTVKQNMHNQQIFGGVDDTAMRIIDYLGDKPLRKEGSENA